MTIGEAWTWIIFGLWCWAVIAGYGAIENKLTRTRGWEWWRRWSWVFVLGAVAVFLTAPTLLAYGVRAVLRSFR